METQCRDGPAQQISSKIEAELFVRRVPGQPGTRRNWRRWRKSTKIREIGHMILDLRHGIHNLRNWEEIVSTVRCWTSPCGMIFTTFKTSLEYEALEHRLFVQQCRPDYQRRLMNLLLWMDLRKDSRKDFLKVLRQTERLSTERHAKLHHDELA